MFWKEYPKILDKPIESVVGAIYENDKWISVISIPRKLGLKKLTMVSAKIVDGRPLDIEIKENVTPRVEYFIYVNNYLDPEEIRWSNNMLIDAKNMTFIEDLANKKREDIIQLQIQLEKEMLKLNENLSKLELALQQKLINKQDVNLENSLIPVYQQRISIFEALINSLKQALKFK